MVEPPRAPAGAPLPAEIGETIGAYRLTELIGAGGMGCVYRGEHQTLGRVAALKVMHPWLVEDERYTRRLKLEAKLVNGLRHPNIVDIVDFIQTEPPVRVACVMELLDGLTLADVLAQRPLSPRQALHAAHQLSEALAAVHAQGIVHRDVNPANIAVVAPLDSDFRSVPCVKLLDFGIAKVADPSVAERTVTGLQVGTPVYMAPEQLAAEEASEATDVYGLMEVLGETLCGRRLFEGEGMQMLRDKLEGRAHVDLPAGVVGRPALAALLKAGLAGDPESRPLLEEIRPRLSALAALQGGGDRLG